MNIEERLIELETRAAFQDDLVQTLNSLVAKQALEIDKLWQANRMLKNQLDSVHATIKDASDEAPPPHY